MIGQQGAESPSTFWIGDEILGRYEIIRVHKGAMGQVFICFDRENAIHVAVKTFQDVSALNEKQRKTFVNEAETWIRLERHPNIVQAYFLENIGGKPYLFLEAILTDNPRGPTIKDYLFTHTINIAEIIGYAVQFCDGMIHAHERMPGIVHRDIKPENIMIDREGNLKITDFGLVKSIGDPFSHVFPPPPKGGRVDVKALIPFVRGTPAFIAPEQILNANQADVRSDIYSFGCVLYELLTRTIPLVGATIESTLEQKLYGTLAPIRKYNSRVPAELEQVVMKCLAREPSQRYLNFKQLRHDLNDVHALLYGVRLIQRKAEELGSGEKMNKAVSMLRLGRKREALRLLEEAAKDDPNHPEIQNRLGVLAVEADDLERAKAAFQSAVRAKNNYGIALNNLGVVCEMLGDRAGAIDAFQHAIHHTPNFSDAYFNLAYLFARLGLTDRAQSLLDTAQREAPNPNIIALWGALLVQQGKSDRAITVLEKARVQYPNHVGIHYTHAATLYDLERYGEARQELDALVTQYPVHGGALYRLALVYLALDNVHAGMKYLERALRIQPANGPAHLRLAAIYAFMHLDLLAQKHLVLAKDLGMDVAPLKAAIDERDALW